MVIDGIQGTAGIRRFSWEKSLEAWQETGLVIHPGCIQSGPWSFTCGDLVPHCVPWGQSAEPGMGDLTASPNVWLSGIHCFVVHRVVLCGPG